MNFELPNSHIRHGPLLFAASSSTDKPTISAKLAMTLEGCWCWLYSLLHKSIATVMAVMLTVLDQNDYNINCHYAITYDDYTLCYYL